MGAEIHISNLEYRHDTTPEQVNTELRRETIKTLSGEWLISLDTETIKNGIPHFFPVIQNDRDPKTHQLAAHAIFGLITVLGSLNIDHEEYNNLGKEAMKHLYFSKDRMEHAGEILTRLENIFGTYKPL